MGIYYKLAIVVLVIQVFFLISLELKNYQYFSIGIATILYGALFILDERLSQSN